MTKDGELTGRVHTVAGHVLVEIKVYVDIDGQSQPAGTRWRSATKEELERFTNTVVATVDSSLLTKEEMDSLVTAFQSTETEQTEGKVISIPAHGGSVTLTAMDIKGVPQTPKMGTETNRISSTVSVTSNTPKEGDNSGGNVNYYSVHIAHPKRPERQPYTFEVEDLIQALNLSFHEGTILKSLIRSATERELGLKKANNDSIRDAEKIVHSGKELLRARTLAKELAKPTPIKDQDPFKGVPLTTKGGVQPSTLLPNIGKLILNVDSKGE